MILILHSLGDSGMGAYHGRFGFDAFTHRRTVVQMPDWLDRLMGFRYPPYDLKKNRGMITRKAPPFKKGETLEDQKSGSRGFGVGVAGATAITIGLVSIALQQRLINPDSVRHFFKA